jgi:hypothetical protein
MGPPGSVLPCPRRDSAGRYRESFRGKCSSIAIDTLEVESGDCNSIARAGTRNRRASAALSFERESVEVS